MRWKLYLVNWVVRMKIRLRKSSVNQFVVNGLFLSELGLYLAYLFSGDPAYVYSIGIFGFLGLVYCYTTDLKKRSILIVSVTCVVGVLVIGMLFHRHYSISNIFRELLTFFSMGCLLARKEINRKGTAFAFYAILAIIVFAVIGEGYPYRIFASKSRNYISAVLITMMFPYYIACFNADEEPSLIPSLATMIVSIYVIGRTGIICSMFLFLVSLIRRIGHKRSTIISKFFVLNVKYFLIAFLIMVVGIYALKKTDVLETYFYRFWEGGYEGDRGTIWGEYLDILLEHPMCWIIGIDFNEAHYLSIFQNAHNSFLMVHAYLGVIGLIPVLIIIFRYLKKVKLEKKWDMLIISLAFLLRASFDWVFMMEFGDIILFYMLFSIAQTNRQKGLGLLNE